MRVRSIVVSGMLATTLIGGIGTTASGADGQRTPPVVLVGVAGLQWLDVSPEATPTLWRLTGNGDTAS
ncbi:MAG TPA: hypothetical protein VFR46_03270, partial [Actinomycetes bacterium]|nr:hypothetical protein [Actinomycetes bacterium]